MFLKFKTKGKYEVFKLKYFNRTFTIYRISLKND